MLSLAQLARLKLNEAEVKGLQKDISSVLDYVGQISNTASGAPAEVPLVCNVLREDAPRAAEDPLFGKEEALRSAFPEREGGYNIVRKIIEKDA